MDLDVVTALVRGRQELLRDKVAQRDDWAMAH